MAQGARGTALTRGRSSGIAIAAAALLLSTAGAEPPSASDWRLASTSKNMVTFVDSGSIERKDGGVRFWSWSILREPSAYGTHYDNYRTLVDASCTEKSYSYRATIYYRGTETTNQTGEEPQLRHASPDSVMDATISGACGPDQLGETTADPVAKARGHFAGDECAAAVDAATEPAAASDWRKAGVAADHVTFVDAASLERDGEQVRFWLWTVYPGSSKDFSPVDNLKSRLTASCKDKSYKALSTTIYLAHRPVKSFGAEPAPTSTVMDQVIDGACHPEQLGESFADPLAAAPGQLRKGGEN